MKPIEKRERLFRKSRPNLRPLEVYDGDDYHKDIKILWVAHMRSPFKEFPNDQDGFVRRLSEIPAEMVIIEDENKEYSSSGPVGLIFILGDEWKIEPHVEFFPWASRRNILRGCVSFLQWARNSRKIGCILIGAFKRSKNLFDHICTYGVLHYVGKVINADPLGDKYIYSVKGKKRCQQADY